MKLTPEHHEETYNVFDKLFSDIIIDNANKFMQDLYISTIHYTHRNPRRYPYQARGRKYNIASKKCDRIGKSMQREYFIID